MNLIYAIDKILRKCYTFYDGNKFDFRYIFFMVITVALSILSFWFKQTWIPMLVVGILNIFIGGLISGILTIVGAVKRKNFDKTLYQAQPNYYYNNGDGNYNNNNGNNNGADMNNVQ